MTVQVWQTTFSPLNYASTLASPAISYYQEVVNASPSTFKSKNESALL